MWTRVALVLLLCRLCLACVLASCDPAICPYELWESDSVEQGIGFFRFALGVPLAVSDLSQTFL